MRKLTFLLAVFACLGHLDVSAQECFNGYFNHVSVGISAGTTGVGLEVATPVGRYFRVRAGVDLFNSVKTDFDLDIATMGASPEAIAYLQSQGINGTEANVDTKINFGAPRLLVDYYPFAKNTFHVTAGAYFAGNNPAVFNTSEETDRMFKTLRDMGDGSNVGIQLDNYLLTPDQNGHVTGEVKTSKFRPYLGVGFGNSVPKKRVAVCVDLGAQFWGSPKVMCNGDELTSSDLDGDSGKAIKTISKLSVYPVLSVRLCGRIL